MDKELKEKLEDIERRIVYLDEKPLKEIRDTVGENWSELKELKKFLRVNSSSNWIAIKLKRIESVVLFVGGVIFILGLIALIHFW